jgi:hypothetical protein
MKKIKIQGITKAKHRSEFIFPKEQGFFEIIRKFLVELGLDMNTSLV